MCNQEKEINDQELADPGGIRPGTLNYLQWQKRDASQWLYRRDTFLRYITQILMCLLETNSEQLIEIFNKEPSIIRWLIHHLTTPEIQDFVRDLLKQQYNTSNTVYEGAAREFHDKLQRQLVERLKENIINNENSLFDFISTLVNHSAVNNYSIMNAFWRKELSDQEFWRRETSKIVMSPAIAQLIRHYLRRHCTDDSLLHQTAASFLQTFTNRLNDAPIGPFGMAHYICLETVNDLLGLKNPLINQLFFNNFVMKTFLNIFLRYPKNNVAHLLLLKIFTVMMNDSAFLEFYSTQLSIREIFSDLVSNSKNGFKFDGGNKGPILLLMTLIDQRVSSSQAPGTWQIILTRLKGESSAQEFDLAADWNGAEIDAKSLTPATPYADSFTTKPTFEVEFAMVQKQEWNNDSFIELPKNLVPKIQIQTATIDEQQFIRGIVLDLISNLQIYDRIIQEPINVEPQQQQQSNSEFDMQDSFIQLSEAKSAVYNNDKLPEFVENFSFGPNKNNLIDNSFNLLSSSGIEMGSWQNPNTNLNYNQSAIDTVSVSSTLSFTSQLTTYSSPSQFDDYSPRQYIDNFSFQQQNSVESLPKALESNNLGQSTPILKTENPSKRLSYNWEPVSIDHILKDETSTKINYSLTKNSAPSVLYTQKIEYNQGILPLETPLFSQSNPQSSSHQITNYEVPRMKTQSDQQQSQRLQSKSFHSFWSSYNNTEQRESSQPPIVDYPPSSSYEHQQQPKITYSNQVEQIPAKKPSFLVTNDTGVQSFSSNSVTNAETPNQGSLKMISTPARPISARITTQPMAVPLILSVANFHLEQNYISRINDLTLKGEPHYNTVPQSVSGPPPQASSFQPSAMSSANILIPANHIKPQEPQQQESIQQKLNSSKPVRRAKIWPDSNSKNKKKNQGQGENGPFVAQTSIPTLNTSPTPILPLEMTKYIPDSSSNQQAQDNDLIKQNIKASDEIHSDLVSNQQGSARMPAFLRNQQAHERTAMI